jgi:hypothetical protein
MCMLSEVLILPRLQRACVGLYEVEDLWGDIEKVHTYRR